MFRSAETNLSSVLGFFLIISRYKMFYTFGNTGQEKGEESGEWRRRRRNSFDPGANVLWIVSVQGLGLFV